MFITKPYVTDRKIRFALVGCGRISANHFAAIEKHAGRAELVAVCDIDPVALEQRIRAVFAHNAYDRLPEIACPTLVITGKDDALVAWQNSELLAQRIPGARLIILEPAGHCFWLEQPQQSRDAMVQFLNSVSGKQ